MKANELTTVVGKNRALTDALLVGTVMAAMVCYFMASPSQAQTASSSNDVLYATSTPAKGACPEMDWHIVVHPDKTANGVVSWDNSKHMVHVTGKLDEHGALQMKTADTSSTGADTVTGVVKQNVLQAHVTGTGTSCDNVTMNVPKAEGSASHG